MLAQDVTRAINEFWDHIQKTNPIFINARDGKIRPEHMQSYVASARYLVQHTPIHLRLALERATALGLSELAEYFRIKLAEEQDHDKWADDDLEKFKTDLKVERSPDVSRAIVELVKQNETMIREAPDLYVVYMYFAEYMTVIAAPTWLKLLSENCGIPVSVMSIIDKHAEADKAHAREGIAELNRILPRSADPGIFMASLKVSMKLIEDFYSDIGERAN